MSKLECRLCGEILPNRSVEGFMEHLQTKHNAEFVDRVEATFFKVLGLEVRLVPFKEISECPQLRLDAQHYIPRHKAYECSEAWKCQS